MSAQDVMLQEAIEAIRQGQRGRARDLLTRLLRTNQSNPEYWLWMSSVVETTKEQIYCLQSVLRLEPDNAAARQGLVLLGALPPQDSIAPVPPVRRKWEISLQEVPKRSLWSRPVVRITVYAGLILVLVSLLSIGAYSLIAYATRPAGRRHHPHQHRRPNSNLHIYSHEYRGVRPAPTHPHPYPGRPSTADLAT